jgi:chitin synthase
MNIVYLVKRVIYYHYRGEAGNNYNYINVYYADIGWITVNVAGFSAFGVYLAAGIISLDPWHIVTTYSQYLFMASSYTNILAVYAFKICTISLGEARMAGKSLALTLCLPSTPERRMNKRHPFWRSLICRRPTWICNSKQR